jgi:gliding motility-associated-like protein
VRILRPWLTDCRVKTSWSILVFILLYHLPKYSTAQDYCDPAQRPASTVEGGFTVVKRVCVGSPITVTNTKTTATSVKYIYGYTADSSLGSAGSSGTTYTFRTKGRYKILQAGSLGATAMIHCEEIDVLPLDAIKFTAQSCLGRRATVTVDQSTLGQYDTYVIRWGDGTAEEKSRADMLTNPTHTYNASITGSIPITLEGRYNLNPSCTSPPTTQSISLLATATPPFISELTTTSDKAIEIKYQSSVGTSILLYQKINGTYTATGQKGSEAGSFTVQTDASQVQCFQLVTQDACNSTPLKSDEVCSLVLDVKAASKQNNLTWQPYAGTTPRFRYYRIMRNGTPTGGTNTNRNINTYADANNITCGTPYCYQIEAIVDGVGPTSIKSARVCVNGINGDAPGDVGNVIVSVEDGHPRLITTPPANIGATDSYTMIVSRASASSGSFQPIATLERESTYTDESANPNAGSYCYQVVYQNGCGLFSKPSPPVCTVFLEAKSPTGIDWNTESPFTPESIDSYTVEVIDSVNGTKQEIQVGGNTHYEPDPNDPNLQSQKYRIIAVSSSGTVSYSNFYTFRREARILVPDAFTPNGDGMNDEFLATGIYIDQFTMNIYNRWGEVVYNTTNRAQGWNGTINGQNAEAGQYMYRIEVVDMTGQKTVRTGALLLIR